AALDELYGSGKGTIPMNSGTPFYTIDQNPVDCGYMEDGDNCEQLWTVNATGEHLSNWTFFTIYESEYEEVYNETEKINVQIIGNYPPEINKAECYDGSSWIDCTTLAYEDTIAQVRVNCTDPDDMLMSIENARFKLTNIPDNNVFFDTDGSYNPSTGYWEYDNDDINILDSGEWELYAQCGDNESAYRNITVEWLVPWGVLEPYLIDPVSDIDVMQNQFFSFSSGVNCVGGECGNVSASLDPIEYSGTVYSIFNNDPDMGVGCTNCDFFDFPGTFNSNWIGMANRFTSGLLEGKCYNITIGGQGSWTGEAYVFLQLESTTLDADLI
ncbi:unnamed protein product, partial [marine sediment metagenome]